MDVPKGAYCLKKYLLNENVLIDRKYAYWMKMCLLKNKKAQLFGVFKCIHDINLCSHMAQ